MSLDGWGWICAEDGWSRDKGGTGQLGGSGLWAAPVITSGSCWESPARSGGIGEERREERGEVPSCSLWV